MDEQQTSGRVEIDREDWALAKDPCLLLWEKLNAAGFPLKLGLMGPEKWKDEEWRWERFREAAAAIGCTRWGFEEDISRTVIVFRWEAGRGGKGSRAEKRKRECRI